MNSFSRDIDILKYEPSLFGDLYFPGQVLLSGSGGQIIDTKFTITNSDFIAAQIEASMVIYLQSADGNIGCAYEIISVNSSTELTVSMLRPNNDFAAIAAINAEDVSYRICSYLPQINEVFSKLTQHFDLRPGNPAAQYSADDILDASVLRQVSAYGALSIIYMTLSGRANDNAENFQKKSQYYDCLYKKALQRCRVTIDLGDDGVGDSVNSGASVKLRRV